VSLLSLIMGSSNSKQFDRSSNRWIGGVQIFLNFSLGAITGKIFDRGYLYVPFVDSPHSIGLVYLAQ